MSVSDGNSGDIDSLMQASRPLRRGKTPPHDASSSHVPDARASSEGEPFIGPGLGNRSVDVQCDPGRYGDLISPLQCRLPTPAHSSFNHSKYNSMRRHSNTAIQRLTDASLLQVCRIRRGIVTSMPGHALMNLSPFCFEWLIAPSFPGVPKQTEKEKAGPPNAGSQKKSI